MATETTVFPTALMYSIALQDFSLNCTHRKFWLLMLVLPWRFSQSQALLA